MANRISAPLTHHGDAAYERARDLPAALGETNAWGLDMDDPAQELAALDESALEGTFGNIRELVAALRHCVEHPGDATLGDLAVALGALRGELAIMNDQVETLVAPLNGPADKN